MSDMINNEEGAEAEFNDDVFESMLNGTFKEEEKDSVDNDSSDLDDETEDNEHQEDTDVDGVDEDNNTDDADDGEDYEDEVLEDDEYEEDSLVDDDDLDDDGNDAEDSDVADDEPAADEELDTDDKSEDTPDTEEPSDGKASDTDGIDYKSFYDAVVNTEFKVNGRKAKGFSDPQKIIQAMQMAGGFSEKMAGFKQYRPFMSPLKERGMLEDQAKFDLAMNIIDGDKEAIKQHLASLEIDPLDLDMEAIQYEATPTTASQESLAVQDALDRARGGGFEDKLRTVIGKEWDADSFNEFTSNPAVREDLINHLETGAFDKVQDKIAEMSMLDYNGSFNGMTSVDKYRAAVKQIQAEAPTTPQPVQPQAPVKEVPKASASVKAEKAKIASARKEDAYKKQVSAKNARIAKERKKAASLSRKKAPAKAKPKFDPMKLEGDELDAHMEFLISGGRG